MTKAIGGEMRPSEVQELLDGGWLEIVYVRSEKSGEVYVTLRPPQGQSLPVPAKPLPDNLIKAEDLVVTVVRPPFGRGQHTNGPSQVEVRVHHKPSGMVVFAEGQSQHRARSIAIDMIIGGLTSPHYRG